MESYEYNDGLRSGGRRPHLYIVKGEEAVRFDGQTIKGMVLVLTQDYTQNGKWSMTRYSLGLPEGVKAVELLSPLHQTWGDKIASWAEAASALGVSDTVARRIVNEAYPRTAGRLDQIEAFE